jgi:hypothetical protein
VDNAVGPEADKQMIKGQALIQRYGLFLAGSALW